MTARDLLGTIASFYGPMPPQRLGVAVSGGSDSLGLLILLAEWGGAELSAATVNHGLRPEAASEALHVARICEGLGVPHDVLEWQGWDGRGNLQDEARRTRYALLARWAKGLGLDAVALGHTRDDQAETVLMRLARGPGVDGLSGMRARIVRDGIAFHRPLLIDGTREDLRRVLSEKGRRWVEDPSNEDTAFERVRARQTLVALAPLGIDAEALGRMAEQLQDARTALNRATSEAAETIGNVVHGDLVFDRAAFRCLPAEIQRRLLGHGLQWVSGQDHPPRRDPLRDTLDAVAEQTNTTLHGCRVLVSSMTVRLVREHASVAQRSGPTDQLWDGRWRLEGPHSEGLVIRALGEGVNACPDWRETGMPRASLLASPAVWKGEDLVAAPIAGLPNGWTAKAPGTDAFAAFLIAH